MSRIKQRLQAGDTIVEVMIVLAVLGSAIGVAYATANRSLLNTRQAQENAEASQLVQSQVEKIRAMAPLGTDTSDTAATNMYSKMKPFCIGDVSSASPLIDFDAAGPVAASNCYYGSLPYKIVVYNCDVSSAQNNAVCGAVASSDDLFIVQASWDDVLGKGTDTSTLRYRVHPGIQ